MGLYTLEGIATPLTPKQRKWLRQVPVELKLVSINGSIFWKGKLSDREVGLIAEIIDLLREDPGHEELAKIINLFSRTRAAKKLRSRKFIKVSPAHKGTSPYEHIVRVFYGLDTSGLDKDEILILRTAALFHDLGKLIYTQNFKSKRDKLRRQVNIDHALIGAKLAYDLLIKTNLLSNQHIKTIVSLVANHHVYEWKQKNDLNMIDLCSKFSIRELELLKRLVLADVGSIEKYRPLIPEINIFFYQLLIIFKYANLPV